MSRKDDLRITKTYKALLDSMLVLLNQRNFNAITINDLCSEALISRATFYTHFNDKYDLLKYFLAELRKNIVKDVYNYEELAIEINGFVALNKKMIKNTFKEANNETLMIVQEFIADIIAISLKKSNKNDLTPNHIMLLNFCVGGVINHLTWIAENNFPTEITMMNEYLYKMLETLLIWDAKQERRENTQSAPKY